MSLLIVDDEDNFRESLRDAFEDEGYDVAVAADGVEALDVLKARDDVRVVILDLMMPRMTGAELYEVMQADPRLARIPVIVATSDASRAPKGVPVLTKPIRLETLRAAVLNACTDR